MELEIKFDELRKLMGIDSIQFPKYATQIINLANQNSQATRPKNVGQMSDLIKEFTGKTLKEWENWYLEKYPTSINTATNKILEMVNNFKDVIDEIDENMVRQWVRDLVIVKTFIGLKLQKAILEKITEKFGLEYRFSTPEEESKGIDGYIENIPISIKPNSYRSKDMLKEEIKVNIVYYKKQKNYFKITISPELVDKLRRIAKTRNE